MFDPNFAISVGVWAPIGVVAAALISAVVSVVTTRISFRQRVSEITIQAQEDYRTEAIKEYRNQVGGPKSQIIESIHDLGDRLYTFLSDDTVDKRTWTKTDQYFRRSFVWLILRPALWIDVLRQRRVELDETLGDVLKEDFQFQRACREFESSLTQTGFFAGTSYDESHDTAHVYAGTLRRIAEMMIPTEPGIPIRYSYFEDTFCGDGASVVEVDPVLRLVSDLDKDDRATQFKLARLVCIYAACMCFLEHCHFPYRSRESPEKALSYLDHVLIDKDMALQVSANIRTKLLDGMWPED